MSRAKSSKAPAVSDWRSFWILSWRDWLIVGAVCLLQIPIINSTSARRALELMPWPDGLEYAAAAMNLAKGRGPVLHFGGYSYPSRYTGGYPLILEFFYHLGGSDYLLSFQIGTWLLGTFSVVIMFILTRWLLSRRAATVAALLLVVSPVFITYSSLIMSDVPTLFVTIYAVLILLGATEGAPNKPNSIRIHRSLMFGVVAGFSTIMRPTNVAILFGLAAYIVMVPERRDLRTLLGAAIAVVIGFAIPVAWQLHQNSINLGSPFASGYSWWVPEVYGAGGKTFSAAYLFGPTLPRNPYGNLIVYVTTLLGLDGFIGHRASPGYSLYPFAAAVFAIIGIVAILQMKEKPATRRLIWFGLGYLGALTALYCFYIFTDIAFILPGAFILFIAAGCGVVATNRYVRDVIRNRNRKSYELVAAASVIVLDVLLVVSLLTEAAVRLSATPSSSQMVESLESLDSSLSKSATVVSNISLLFLDLYLGEQRSFVGLNSLDPGERFTDYHLHRLYEKRAAGWNGPVPPVVFDGARMSAEADSLASAIAGKTPVYLIVAAPESQQYADVLKGEMSELAAKFSVEPVSENEAIAVYRVSAKE